MGDPRRLKKKFIPPRHPWIKENIETEGELIKEFAIKRKKEIYKLNSILKSFKDQAKKLIAAKTQQAEKEKQQLMQRLQKLSLIKAGAALDDILSLTINDIMARRLQNLVYKKGLARTQAQARQFVIHHHIMIGDKKITSPNYLVSQVEEEKIRFFPRSKLSSAEHPERSIEEKIPVRPAPKEAETEEKKQKKTKQKKDTKKKKEKLSQKVESPKEPEQEKNETK